MARLPISRAVSADHLAFRQRSPCRMTVWARYALDLGSQRTETYCFMEPPAEDGGTVGFRAPHYQYPAKHGTPGGRRGAALNMRLCQGGASSWNTFNTDS